MQDRWPEDLEIEISGLDACGDSSAPGRHVHWVENRFLHRIRRPRLLPAGATMVLVLLLLHSVIPISIPPTPARVSVFPLTNRFAAAFESVPGQTLVVSTDGVLSALHWGAGTELWRYIERKGVWGEPVVSQGSISVNTLDGSVAALQATTGKVLWTFHERAHQTSVLRVGENGTVFVLTQALVRMAEGGVVALRAGDGTRLWQHPTFHFGGLLCDRGVAYIGDAGGGLITAVRSSDGALLWYRQNKGVSSWMSTADNRVFVVTREGDIVALHASNGALLWHTHVGVGTAGAPLVSERKVFIPTPDGGMSVLDAMTGAQSWHAKADPILVTHGLVYSLTDDGRLLVLHASNGALLTSYGDVENTIPTVVQGEVFAVTGGGDLIALRAALGTGLWTYRAASPVAALHAAGALVYVSEENGSIVALQTRTGSVFWNR